LIPEKFEGAFKSLDSIYQRHGHLDARQKALWVALKSGKDIIYTQERLQDRTHMYNILALYCMTNLLGHRKDILRHNQKISQALTDGSEPPLYRDQGFTRASLLIILPMRHAAYCMINALLALSLRAQIDKKVRFMEDFAPNEDELADDPSKPGIIG
jgi:U3 small nucleolar RNA-associated protein 25